MEPGDGGLLDVRFATDPDLSFADNDIRVEDYGTCQLQFVTDRGPYVPQVTNGSVQIREEYVRRPTGRVGP